MKKGTKFRVCPKLNIDSVFQDVCKAFDSYCKKWARKEKVELQKFDIWLANLKRVFKNRIYRYKSGNNNFSTVNLKQSKVAKSIEELQERFVITNIDKAGNNFGIICKKYYLDVLKKELGISNTADIRGNDVYKLHKQSIDNLIDTHKDVIERNFNIKISEENSSIPLLFWIPKLHKNPVKSRFIAGASKCTTKQLSKEVTLCLTTIRNHFRKYCNTIFIRRRINCFWSINNSSEFVSKIKDLKAESIKCFDFSTLYTNLPLDEVKSCLSTLITTMYKHTNKPYININKIGRASCRERV